MQVQVSAFDVEVESEVTELTALIKNLAEMNGWQPEERREYYFDELSFPGFCVGVVITIKDQKSFCTLDEGEDGASVIRVNGLEEGNSIMDFNFFVINMDNGIGLYQHYHQSASISALQKRFTIGLKDLCETLADDEIALEEGRKGKELSKTAKTRIFRKHKSKVTVRTLVSRETLQNLLERYSKIKGMEYSYSVLAPVVRNATPLGARVAKKKENITFSNPSIVSTLSREISRAVRDYSIGKGRVFVEDAQGVRDVVKIFDMPEKLWEIDYDEVVQMIDNINVSDFAGNNFLQSMVDIFDRAEYAHILRADVE
ncbi:hypothetical protein RAL92_21825 [Metapseudomonas otitidis]|uniref:hypothetical protein n=1 Tax=Metapseudomonas otitidis TaxID=319939 RepID=UPI0032167C14